MDPVTAIAVVDDEEILLDGVEQWLSRGGSGLRVEATARTVDDLLRTGPHGWRVVLLDLLLRDGNSPADNVTRLVSAGFTVVAFSSRDNLASIRAAIAAGAHSYVRKARDPTEVHAAIRAAAAGRPYTSPVHAAAMESATGSGAAALSIQEREALRLYASGMTIPQAAARMHVEPSTAKGYIDRARRKYEELGRTAHTKIDLRERALEDGLLTAPDPDR